MRSLLASSRSFDLDLKAQRWLHVVVDADNVQAPCAGTGCILGSRELFRNSVPLMGWYAAKDVRQKL